MGEEPERHDRQAASRPVTIKARQFLFREQRMKRLCTIRVPRTGRYETGKPDIKGFSQIQRGTRILGKQKAQRIENIGDPSRIRTCNPRSRNPLLYPVELWDRRQCPEIDRMLAEIAPQNIHDP